MKRYLRLYKHFLMMSFGKATAYRFDFWCRILMDIAYYSVSIAFFKIIFLKTSVLGGWTEPQVLIFISAHILVDAMQMTFFSSNLWSLPSVINTGELDYYLVKPVSSLFILSLRDFAVNSSLNLLFAIGFMTWALVNYPLPFTALQLFSFLFFLMVGVYLYYNTRLLFAFPVFWTHSPYGFERVFLALLPFMERPDGLFTGAVRWVILTILPFALMTSIPARIFFDGLTWMIFLNVALVTLLITMAVQFIWRRGLRVYGSASS